MIIRLIIIINLWKLFAAKKWQGLVMGSYLSILKPMDHWDLFRPLYRELYLSDHVMEFDVS